ncbi:Serine protease AprX [Methanosarcinales archaeon]|nr:S8 family serine peptidase [Candidatus Methanoperedens sp.]CAG1004116.1 Serine protease AprX [Methanosarcinales archaeon]
MSDYKKTLTIIISFFLIVFISAGSSPVPDNLDNHDNDSILLKNAKIDTSFAQPSKSVQNISIAISQNQADENGYYLVQFKGYTKEEWKQALRASGAVLYDYVPNNAFIAMMNSSVKSQVEALDSVKWVGIYEPGYRISPALSSSAAIMGQGSVNENITVLLFDATENKRVSDEITGLGGEILSNSGDRIRVSIAKTKIPDVARINGVSWMEKYVRPVLMNDVAANITTAYSFRNTHGLTGAGQIVAVADTGLDTGVNDTTMHDDIEGRIVALIDLSGNGAADTFSGHGTHVAGSVLGNGARSGGQFKGMAPGAQLVFQAVESTRDSLSGIPSDLNILFQQAYDQGARIHSNSWGYINYNGVYNFDSKDTDNFVWNHQDMLILFAAGNEGVDGNSNGVIDQDSIAPPATAKNSLSIGSSENNRTLLNYIYSTFLEDGAIYFPSEPINSDKLADNIDGLAAFSGRGPTDDGRIKPDVVAPGTFVLSLRSSAAVNGLWGDYNAYYRYSGGTSMSTPIVAGIAALARQYYVQNESITPSAALLKATIINGAHNMTPGQYGTGATQEIQTRPDYAQGWGRVDIENSLFPASPRAMRYYDNSTGLSTSQYWNVSYNVNNSSEPLRVTLVWSDYPGVPYAGITLVNNLDLTVTGPNGTYYGNGAPDNRNNVEQVELISPSSGSYTIRVNGTNIPQGPQPFAVVISGALDFLPPSASNEFPTNNSYTNNNTTNAAVNITDSVSGVNLSSTDMMINGSYVSFSNTPIFNGYRIQNVTTVPYSDGRVNVSINATNNDSKSLIYSWSFIVDTIAPQVTINPVSYQRANAAKTGSIIQLNVSANDPVVNSTSSGLKNASANVSLINNTGIIALTNNSGFWTGNVTLDRSVDDGNYSLNVLFSDNAGNINSSEYINVTIDNTPPSVTDVSVSMSVSPAVINLTDSINITANITSPDSVSQVNHSEINARITYPNGTSVNYSMFNGSGDLFYKNFSDTAQYGLYNVTILANDTTGNTNSTQQTRFTTSRISNLVVITGSNTETLTAAPYSNTTLRLYTNNSSNGTIQISQSKVNLTSNTSDFSNPGIYVLVNASQDIRNNLTYVVLSVNYTDADVSSFVESSLRLYRWNTTSSAWEKLSGPGSPSFVNDAGVDTANNFVWANLTNLSEFAIGGSLYTPPAQQIASSGGGGGGGGGGGASGENYSNIEVTEKYDLSIYKDKVTSYVFKNNSNPVMFVNVTGNTSFGDITASIEVLRSNSTMVKVHPPGNTYKNINIWVGSSSFNRPKNIKEGIIRFRVLNSWLESNSITNIKMLMWDGSDWKELETNEITKDGIYTYYDASTQSFANFAITGTTGQTGMQFSTSPLLKNVEPDPTESVKIVAGSAKKAPGFEISTLILSLCYVFFLFRQQKK